MNKIFLSIIAALLAVVIVVFFSGLIPASVGPLYLYLLIIALDFYLWTSVKPLLTALNVWLLSLMTFLYWLPLLMLAMAFTVMLFVPIGFWPQGIRIWVLPLIGIAYFSKVIPALFLLMADLLRLTRFLIRCVGDAGCKQTDHQKLQMSRSRFLRNVGMIGGGLVFSGMLAGMIKWVYDFKVHRIRVPLKNLPKSFDGFQIVQISDLHLGSWISEEPLLDAIAIMNSLKPDLVVFTGDLVNYRTSEAEGFIDALKKINARNGVITVLGNHDYGDYYKWENKAEKEQNMADLLDLYNLLGWKLLRNDSTVIKCNNESLGIIGVENWGSNPRFPRKGDVDQAKKSLSTDVQARILLSHDPTHWEKIVSQQHPDIGFTLAGHTHGMQMGIEVGAFKWSPAQYIYRYWAGLYKNGNSEQYLYVNRGLGHIGYPGRIGILPEITLIELVATS